MASPPANTEHITLHEATPVTSRMAAPTRMATIDVSPGEPAMVPMKASHVVMGSPTTLCSDSESPTLVAICPSGVAPEKVSTVVPAPMPKAASVLTKASSPLMREGYPKKSTARVMSAPLKMFLPVPPNTSLAKMTAKAVATATIHSGVLMGTMSGIKMPVTRNPSWISLW